MRRVKCKVCKEWFDSEGAWVCSGACWESEKKRTERLAELSRQLDAKREEAFQEKLRNAGKKKEISAKKKKRRLRALSERLTKLKARENLRPSGSRRVLIEKLVMAGAKVSELQVELKATTEKVRALKQGREPNGFYESRQWQELRYRAIRTYGRRCMCCGETKGQMHVDHIKPRSKFPNLALCFENLQILCRACNMGKSNIDDTDWRGITQQC